MWTFELHIDLVVPFLVKVRLIHTFLTLEQFLPELCFKLFCVS